MTPRALKQGLLALPGVGVSLFPKLRCPACWPAYAALAVWGACHRCIALEWLAAPAVRSRGWRFCATERQGK